MMNSADIILPSSYLGNVEYFYHLLNSRKVVIDIHEPFQKQTYRSRCEIMTSNGRMNLSVPVERPDGSNTIFKDVLISYKEDWQKDHLKSLESAYARTPYYEYYIDQIIEIFLKKDQFLWELNQELTYFIADKMELSAQLEFSKESIGLIESDLRATLIPKNDTGFRPQRYIQPFEEVHGFQANLSSLDLLFNEGPNSISILQESTLQPKF